MKNPSRIRVGRADDIERLQAIDKAARSRYAALAGFAFAAQASEIAAERLLAGKVLVAEVNDVVVGFVLLQSHGNTIYLANISVVPDVPGVGSDLLAHSLSQANSAGASAITLATFRTPPWNGPWFRRQGFVPIPEDQIGPMLRTILDRHSQFLDMSTRETLWRQIG